MSCFWNINFYWIRIHICKDGKKFYQAPEVANRVDPILYQLVLQNLRCDYYDVIFGL